MPKLELIGKNARKQAKAEAKAAKLAEKKRIKEEAKQTVPLNTVTKQPAASDSHEKRSRLASDIEDDMRPMHIIDLSVSDVDEEDEGESASEEEDAPPPPQKRASRISIIGSLATQRKSPTAKGVKMAAFSEEAEVELHRF